MTTTTDILYGPLNRMRHVERFGGIPHLYAENVAEHSFWTAMIAMAITIETGQGTLMGEVLAQALLHDVEESMTGDIVREMKYASPEVRAAIAAVEEEFAGRLFDTGTQVGGAMWFHWLHAKGPTPAGEIVALADLLCVLSYVRHERDLGNTSLDHIGVQCCGLIGEKFDDHELLWPIAARAIEKGGFLAPTNDTR